MSATLIDNQVDKTSISDGSNGENSTGEPASKRGRRSGPDIHTRRGDLDETFIIVVDRIFGFDQKSVVKRRDFDRYFTIPRNGSVARVKEDLGNPDGFRFDPIKGHNATNVVNEKARDKRIGEFLDKRMILRFDPKNETVEQAMIRGSIAVVEHNESLITPIPNEGKERLIQTPFQGTRNPLG